MAWKLEWNPWVLLDFLGHLIHDTIAPDRHRQTKVDSHYDSGEFHCEPFISGVIGSWFFL